MSAILPLDYIASYFSDIETKWYFLVKNTVAGVSLSGFKSQIHYLLVATSWENHFRRNHSYYADKMKKDVAHSK